MSRSAVDNRVLPLDALVRSMGINKSTPHLFFLGAGASISSGIPSAERCIWKWKRNIFLTPNPELEEQFSELSLVGVRQRIQRWLDQRSTYPREGSPDEYGYNGSFLERDRRNAAQGRLTHTHGRFLFR